MASPVVPQTPTLADAQAFMLNLLQDRIDRGLWKKISGPELCMLLAEEMGEVAKEVRRLHYNEKCTPDTPRDLGYELVDMLNYICRIASAYDIDLQTAYCEKNRILLERFPA